MIGIESMGKRVRHRFALFDYGFRPFFLFAGLYAAIGILGWIGAWHGAWTPATPLAFSQWHAREMVFGFGTAALAGFLLTAVPNWTAMGPVRGARLASLSGLWLAGRIMAWLSGEEAALAFAMVDLTFLPALAASIAPGIVKRNLRRNGAFVLMLVILTAANAATHAEALGADWASARWGIELGLGVLLVMISIIGGRIVPAFTIGGLRMAGRPVAIEPAPRLDLLAIAATAGFVIAQAIGADEAFVGAVSAAAAAAHCARLARWHGWRSFGTPLVWILHLAYAWLIVGFAVMAAHGLGAPVAASAGFHALGAGAVGTMILAVMSRASLGHTGRTLVADRATVIAYWLVTAGACLRVVAGLFPGHVDVAMIGLAGGLWAGGFAVFTARYLPILVGPRVDGQVG
ncbi:MAG TPA: NnrS family protein [Alphaproteobacteria bacterium]|nr:NnrS family protein [Alphaproteobacteria bacterium]